MMEPIKAERYIRRDDQWIDVCIYGFVAVQSVAFMGTDASKVHAIYVRVGGDGKLEADSIDSFRVVRDA